MDMKGTDPQVLTDRRWFLLDRNAADAFDDLLERPAVFKPRLHALLAEGKDSNE
jgi:uncharacterized protein (DUF1778 family)